MASISIPPILDTAKFRNLNLQLLNKIANQGGGLLGSVAVSNFPATQPVSGNVGVTGEVEIVNDVGNPIPVSFGNINPDFQDFVTATPTTPGAINTADYATLAFSVNGGATGSLIIEGSVDGTNWAATNYIALTSGGSSSSFNVAGLTIGQINTAGLSQVRFRSNTISGPVRIDYVISHNGYGVAFDHAIPSGSNVIGGTYSTPNVAAGTLLNQGSTGYTTAGGTLAAATRKYLLIQNTGTTNPLYVSTDGSTPTATNGFTLAANGGGLVFDGSFVPNGAIKLASTATNFSILWA
jgi:hypothetical protein